MNLREAYLYINENKLQDFIKKRCNRITSIKFMLEDVVYAHVFSNSQLALNAIMCAIRVTAPCGDNDICRYTTRVPCAELDALVKKSKGE